MYKTLKPLVLPSGKRLDKGASLKDGLLAPEAIAHLVAIGVLRETDPLRGHGATQEQTAPLPEPAEPEFAPLTDHPLVRPSRRKPDPEVSADVAVS